MRLSTHMNKIKESTEATFKEDTNKKNKPVLVYFWAEWCNPCKHMGSLYEEFSKRADNVELLKVDADSNKSLSQQYSIMSVPTFLLFQNGEVIAQKVGSMSLEELKSFTTI